MTVLQTSAIRFLVVAAVLLTLSDEAIAKNCYIMRNVTDTDTLITLRWTGIYQSPTPRVMLGYTIDGAWYNNTTEGGMNRDKCTQMVTDKARREGTSWPNPGFKCVLSYYDNTLVYTHPTWCADRSDPPPPNSTYRMNGSFACYGGAEYPQTWRSEAACYGYGCNFGKRDLQSCLALGAQKGAREVIHGNAGGSRSNECWLQHSCADLRPNGDFADYRPGGVTPQPPSPPVNRSYVNRGAYACYGGAEYPESWRSQAACGGYGCNFGKLSLDRCLALGAEKGAQEVIHGNPGGGRSEECWLQNSCTNLGPHTEFTLFRPGS